MGFVPLAGVGQLQAGVPDQTVAFSLVAWGIAVGVLLLGLVMMWYRFFGVLDRDERRRKKEMKQTSKTLKRRRTASITRLEEIEPDVRYLFDNGEIEGFGTRWRARLDWLFTGDGVRVRAAATTCHDGRRIYLASVERKRLAARDPQRLLEDIKTVVDAYLDGASVGKRRSEATGRDRVPATASEYYYRDLKRGFEGDDRTSNQRMHVECRRDMIANLRRSGELHWEKLVDGIEREHRYPRDVALDELPTVLESPNADLRKDGRIVWDSFRMS